MQNQQAMALTHGFAHGLVESVLFNIRLGFMNIGLADATCACATRDSNLVTGLTVRHSRAFLVFIVIICCER